jgi:hypothetical protein
MRSWRNLPIPNALNLRRAARYARLELVMEEHEIDRIAAAMHQLRPDWPVKSLKTMLHNPTLKDRPRRDVCVALAWVACEPNTATPGRVLEAGPWWRAAAIENAGGGPRDNIPNHLRCAVCYQAQPRCEAVRFADDDHTFRPATTDIKRSPDAIHQIVEEAKGRLEQTRDHEPAADRTTGKLRELLPSPAHPTPTKETT